MARVNAMFTSLMYHNVIAFSSRFKSIHLKNQYPVKVKRMENHNQSVYSSNEESILMKFVHVEIDTSSTRQLTTSLVRWF